MDRQCDICDKYDKCYVLPCSLTYSPDYVLDEDLEENIMDHTDVQYICTTCIINSRQKCPFCLTNYVIRHKDNICRKIINRIILIFLIATIMVTLGLSYGGVVGMFGNIPIYSKIGYICDLIITFSIFVFLFQVDYRMNETLVFIMLISLYNILYDVMFFFNLGMNFIPWIHFGIISLMYLSYYHMWFCCIPIMCKKWHPESIIEIVSY